MVTVTVFNVSQDWSELLSQFISLSFSLSHSPPLTCSLFLSLSPAIPPSFLSLSFSPLTPPPPPSLHPSLRSDDDDFIVLVTRGCPALAAGCRGGGARVGVALAVRQTDGQTDGHSPCPPSSPVAGGAALRHGYAHHRAAADAESGRAGLSQGFLSQPGEAPPPHKILLCI